MAIDTSNVLVGMQLTPYGLLQLAEAQEELPCDSIEECEGVLEMMADFVQEQCGHQETPALVFDGARWLFAIADIGQVSALKAEARAPRKVAVRAPKAEVS
jgi:hypothetical protein